MGRLCPPSPQPCGAVPPPTSRRLARNPQPAHTTLRALPNATSKLMLPCCTEALPPDLAQPLLPLGPGRGGPEGRRQPRGAAAGAGPALPPAVAAAAEDDLARQRVRESAARFVQQDSQARQRANREAGRRLQQLEVEARSRIRQWAEVRSGRLASGCQGCNG